MDFRVKFSLQAAEDLSDIITYINDTLYNPSAAARFYKEVQTRLGLISKNPLMYPLSRDERLSAGGIRAAVIGNYLMFYFVDEANALVYITRIAYGKRDIATLLEEKENPRS